MATAQKKSTKGKTPLMRQYYRIKERHPQVVLLYRMGDFYEAFDEDAKTLSRILGITLTKRANGKASEVPMAGFPHHALDNHLPKLVQSGLRVAICEQVEDADEAGGKVVERDVVEVVTPGVSFHDQLLSPKQSNYLAAIYWDGAQAGFSFIDASTGEFSVTEVPADALDELMQTVAPAEVLIDKGQRRRLEQLDEQNFVLTPQEDWAFSYDFAYETLLQHFETHSLKGFGVDDMNHGLIAAGAALHYLGETQKGKVPHVRRIQRYQRDAYMTLDPQTKRNLELVTTIRQGSDGPEGSLVNILDESQSPMGGRLLRKWLVRPLRSVQQIENRLEAVAALVDRRPRRGQLREELDQIGDLERLAGKVATGRAKPRDLISIKLTLRRIPPLQELLDDVDCPTLRSLADDFNRCQFIVDRVEQALVDEPPSNITEGGLIRDGYSEELDELRRTAASGKDWVAQLEKDESERTNIPSLKVGFNKVFGYYIEVTNTHKEKVPEDYIRKQTLVNSERYITPELKEYEEKILTAEERIASLEQELFNELRTTLAEHTDELQHNAGLLARLDCLTALAEVADRYDYTRPEVHTGRTLHIDGGRHPVVEQTLPPGESFIPNSVTVDPEEEQILIITGPNMAGKSVVLRQTGLIVLLAQIGSFVPAASARVGVVDRIFTRVGASDNLAAGESTFLVEMNETANILNNASPRSLILLDEVGRGTSTFDGLSIAWALVEYLHGQPELQARTLFATHYHELNELADRFERIRNYRIQVQEHDGKIVFLRKLVPGGADHSYGIEVARMAGLPEPVVQRARSVLEHLESHQLNVDGAGGDGAGAQPRGRPTDTDGLPDVQQTSFQRSLFEADETAVEIKSTLREIDTNRITPVEALLKLAELKQRAEEG